MAVTTTVDSGKGKLARFIDRAFKAGRDNDPNELEAIKSEVPGPATEQTGDAIHVHLHPEHGAHGDEHENEDQNIIEGREEELERGMMGSERERHARMEPHGREEPHFDRERRPHRDYGPGGHMGAARLGSTGGHGMYEDTYTHRRRPLLDKAILDRRGLEDFRRTEEDRRRAEEDRAAADRGRINKGLRRAGSRDAEVKDRRSAEDRRRAEEDRRREEEDRYYDQDPAVSGGGEYGEGGPHGSEAGGITLESLAQQLAEMRDLLAELAESEEEEVQLEKQGEADPEMDMVERRRHLHDRRSKVRDAFRKFRRTRDDGNVEELERDPDADGWKPEGTGPGENRVKSEPLPKMGTGDRRRTHDRRTTDSVSLKDSFEEVVAKAEILAPGMRMPTFDAAIAHSNTLDRMCGLRRRALDVGYRISESGAAIDQVIGKQSFNLRTATCDQVEHVFNASAAVMAAQNRGLTAGRRGVITGDTEIDMPSTVADYNKRMREKFNPWKNGGI